MHWTFVLLLRRVLCKYCVTECIVYIVIVVLYRTVLVLLNKQLGKKNSSLENTCEDEEGVAAGGVGAAWRGEGAPMRRGETMVLPPMSIAMFTCST